MSRANEHKWLCFFPKRVQGFTLFTSTMHFIQHILASIFFSKRNPTHQNKSQNKKKPSSQQGQKSTVKQGKCLDFIRLSFAVQRRPKWPVPKSVLLLGKCSIWTTSMWILFICSSLILISFLKFSIKCKKVKCKKVAQFWGDCSKCPNKPFYIPQITSKKNK